MSKRNRSIPQIPKPATPAAEPIVQIPATKAETKPASDLTKSALALLQQNFSAQAEAIAAQAAKAEGIDPAQGWKLDLSGVWFRPKRPQKDKKKA